MDQEDLYPDATARAAMLEAEEEATAPEREAFPPHDRYPLPIPCTDDPFNPRPLQ